MPGAKYVIERKCKVCGITFHARQIDSQFCSQRCSKKFSKRKKKEAERQKRLSEIESSVPNIRDLLSVKEATAIYAVCRDTIYRLIRLKRLSVINLNQRLIRISRTELESRFPHRAVAVKNQEKPEPKLYSMEPEDCYTIGEITEKYGISEKTVYEMIRRRGIPIRQIGRFVYAPKKEIEKILSGN